jgi:hypothetical protein
MNPITGLPGVNGSFVQWFGGLTWRNAGVLTGKPRRNRHSDGQYLAFGASIYID